ncbi:MAG: hybrid sensor histidine kinase/response regulator [Armatimonadota bacterium]|nr:hybrid sensor histidine kinase/response regulator [Armatimonadota bacterium]
MSARPPSILIIDDEEIVLDSCTEILAGGPYAVFTANNGALGLEHVERRHPDLVLVDLKMPGISGMQVVERIHALDPTIVTIVITGYATLNAAVEAMQKGAFDFVAKPFTPEEFRLVVQRGLERRRLIQEAAALRAEREMLREHFAAVVSHELKAPLGALQQNLMALAFELSGVLTDAQKARLERLKARVDDLLAMIQTWMRAFAIDVRKIQEGFKPVDIRTVIAKALDSVQPYAQRKDIEIVTTIHEPLREVLGDEGTLIEALVNLASNAVKYSRPGSRVLIEAREHAGQVLVSVQDFGVGIPADEMPYLFGDFYRGQAGKTEQGGAGLGLAITRRIIEAHHGSITVESTPGEGSTFLITLPLPQDNAGGRAPVVERVLQNSLPGGVA